jgi:hypothetical protein
MCIRYMCVPAKLAEQDFFKYGSKPFRDRLVAFCMVLLLEGGMRRKEDTSRRSWRDWRRIHSDRIRDYINPNYTKFVKDTLIAAKIIECDDSYQVDKYSLGYRFAKMIRKNAFEHYAFETSRGLDRFCKALNIKKPQSGIEPQIRGPVTPTTSKLFDLMTRLELPEEQMLKVVDSANLEDRLYHYRQGYAFHRKQFSATVDDTGRFYTSLTNLWKNLRHLLLIQNEPLIEIDVSACQPLMLSLMVEPFVARHECIRFRELTESGMLYDEIAKFTGRPRDKAKRGFLSFLCAEIPRNGFHDLSSKASLRTLILEWFQSSFPQIADYLIETKSSAQSRMRMNTEIRRKAGKKTSAYAITAFEMQRLEAEIMLEGVCTQFLTRYPDEFIAPVHDAVLVQEKMRFAAEEILREQFGTRGLKPRVGVTKGGVKQSADVRDEKAIMFNAFSTQPMRHAQSLIAP